MTLKHVGAAWALRSVGPRRSRERCGRRPIPRRRSPTLAGLLVGPLGGLATETANLSFSDATTLCDGRAARAFGRLRRRQSPRPSRGRSSSSPSPGEKPQKARRSSPRTTIMWKRRFSRPLAFHSEPSSHDASPPRPLARGSSSEAHTSRRPVVPERAASLCRDPVAGHAAPARERPGRGTGDGSLAFGTRGRGTRDRFWDTRSISGVWDSRARRHGSRLARSMPQDCSGGPVRCGALFSFKQGA